MLKWFVRSGFPHTKVHVCCTYTHGNHGNHRDPTFSCSYGYVWETRGFRRCSDAPCRSGLLAFGLILWGELELGKESGGGDHWIRELSWSWIGESRAEER